MDYLKLTPDALSVDEISNLVVDDTCGAVSMFIGTTRDNFEGRKVIHLEYEAYEPMALKSMKSICDDIRNKWPTVYSIAIYHRLGTVPTREASVVIAISSPHRQQSLEAVAFCIDQLKAQVPIWKKEIYDDHAPVWKENVESSKIEDSTLRLRDEKPRRIPSNLVQINVSNEELQNRIDNFINVKREQVNISNVHDFIPSKCESEDEEAETCARVRTQFVKRNDSKGHLKIRKVVNEWGPQTLLPSIKQEPTEPTLPSSIAERVSNVERFLNIKGPVSKDIYRRLKDMEDKIAVLTAISPEYAHFWKTGDHNMQDEGIDKKMECLFTAEDIANRIEDIKRESNF